MAEEIAKLVIDQSYWGDQWFLFFCLLVVALVAAISSWGGSYLSTRAQNSAMRADFQRALEDLEEQTKAVKRIEEEISHKYLEQREVFRIKREKVEYLYLELEREMGLLSHNFRVVAMDASEDVVTTSHNVEMMLSLYFKNELRKELDFYRDKKNVTVR
ncbi:hypothetical protein [Marinobacter maritimus]|uniref:hypothetical protein n=1 Tax=Marinobacter maritimus TaxID=277961 RepID=UPI0011A2D0C4|nr:hypothetical protein [Marinobacter maritimus]